MLKELPLSLIQASQHILENATVSLTEIDVVEDAISQMDIPGEDEPEEELSGEVETVVINPEYKTFRAMRPY